MVEIKAATQKSKQVTETHRCNQAFKKKKNPYTRFDGDFFF